MLSALLILAGLADPEGVVATAPRTGDGAVRAAAPAPASVPTQSLTPPDPTAQDLTTAEQIDRWIAARDPSARPFAEDTAVEAGEGRRMHGEVSAAIGTGGYNAFGAAVTIPLGEIGFVHLSYSQSKNGHGYYGYGPYGHWNDGWGWPQDGAWRRQRVFEQERRPEARDTQP